MPPDLTSPDAAKVKWHTSFVPPRKRAALAGVLAPGEIIHWASGPDRASTLHGARWLWWIGIPWSAGAIALWLLGRLGEGWEMFALAPGLALTAAPFVLLYSAQGTTYAITNRRAIIKHDTVSRRRVVSVDFADMDDKLEILPVRPGIGHLYFASDQSTKLEDVDYTGKLAFRHLAAPEKVADLLDRARNAGAS
jgi:hypothetical protein